MDLNLFATAANALLLGIGGILTARSIARLNNAQATAAEDTGRAWSHQSDASAKATAETAVVAGFKDLFAEMRADHESLRQQNREQQGQINELKAMHRECQEKHAALQDEHAELKDEHEELKAKVASIENKVNSNH